jgi:hypothetical protein
MMKGVQSPWQFPANKFQRNMSSEHSPIMGMYDAITIRIDVSAPEPTPAVWFWDILSIESLL